MTTHRSTFLGEVARILYARYGEEFSSLSLLFPSRRARLFFADELAHVADRPLWEPEWLALEQLMEELSDLRTGDRLRLIVELYRIYCRYHREDFDSFYFWGDRLLADFDMVDKYLVDADMLFRNISDLKELEADLSYLTPEQREVINRFWDDVLNRSDDSPERRRFLGIWSTLGSIYRDFRKRLLELGFAYPGLVQRRAAERLLAGEASLDAGKRYVVAGFNALSACEKVLFDHLKVQGADFYWDYDDSYLRPEWQEAGMFLRENCRRYPEPMGEITHDNAQNDKELHVVSMVSDAVQCKSLPLLLDGFRRRDTDGRPMPLDKRTAIVLTDETLLMPLLSSLTPAEGQLEPDAVNVTMGFPLKQTAAYTFLERLVELQSHSREKEGQVLFYHADVSGILSHPYLSDVDDDLLRELKREMIENRRVMVPAMLLHRGEFLSQLFRRANDWRELSDWLLALLRLIGEGATGAFEADERTSSLMVMAEEMTKLRNSIELCEMDISMQIYASLLRKHLQTLRIPFDGEPLNGVQVMGILETRNLDFDQVIILSMTDDNFPGRLDAAASYIPYNLRAAYGLPTPEHHEGVYSYYFYRLIQRARRVVMCYCSHADEKSTGEPSRYIRQLEYESGRKIRFAKVGVDVNLPEMSGVVVEKSGAVREALEGYLRPENPVSISPTAFARYLSCPLKFYFASIAHLKEREEIADEVDNPLFGTLLHASMELLYRKICGESHPARTLEALVKAGAVERSVRVAIEAELYRGEPTSEHDYPGNLLLVRDIVVRYIREGILPYDCRNDGFTVLGLELPVSSLFKLDSTRCIRFAGKADRVDRLDDGSLRVVDYKTGAIHLEYNGLDDLFETKNRGRNGNIFQTLLYALMLWYSRSTDALPALYYVRRLNHADYSPYLIDKSLCNNKVRYSDLRIDFENRMRTKLLELFNYDEPFRGCDDVEQCLFCDFKALCRR